MKHMLDALTTQIEPIALTDEDDGLGIFGEGMEVEEMETEVNEQETLDIQMIKSGIERVAIPMKQVTPQFVEAKHLTSAEEESLEKLRVAIGKYKLFKYFKEDPLSYASGDENERRANNLVIALNKLSLDWKPVRGGRTTRRDDWLDEVILF